MPRASVAGAGILLLAVLAAGAARAGDPKVGHRLAEQWCASCHAIEAPRIASDMAPPFRSIVNERGRTDAFLRSWLTNPHPPMPNPGLARQEIEDIVSYLDTLRKRSN